MLMMKQQRRQKPDKWRNLLRDVTTEWSTMSAKVQELEKQKVELEYKEDMLLLMIEALGAVAHNMAAAASGPAHQPGPVPAPAGSGTNSTSSSSIPGSLKPPIDQSLRIVYECEQQIQHSLSLVRMIGDGQQRHQSSSWQGCINVLNSLFDPVRVQEVLDMPVERIGMLMREYSGKCAIMLVQEASDAVQEPAFQFMQLVLILMLWDDRRFSLISSMNLDTLQPGQLQPKEFWRSAAARLRLTPQQVATLKCLRQHMCTAWPAMAGSMTQISVQQGSLTQQQSNMVRQQQQQLVSPLQHQGSQQQHQQQQQDAGQIDPHEQLAMQVKQLRLAQQDALNLQQRALQQWKLLALQMGIVTIDLLTPHQLAVFIAASYPNTPRIDQVMIAVDELDELQQPSSQTPSPTPTQQHSQPASGDSDDKTSG